MNTFTQAVNKDQNKVKKVLTTNGAKAFSGTGDNTLNYFSKIGARRGDDNVGLFLNAFHENKDLAIRALLWTRDVRGGAGERQSFRDILLHLALNQYKTAIKVLHKIPELGRWDDLLVLFGTPVENECLDLIKSGLESGNGLCAKWMPRKGDKAVKIREYLGYSPKRYRKTLVTLSNTVEQKMCSKEWDDIDFSHVPSRAMYIYRDAFKRNTGKYEVWLNKLTRGDVDVKVNSSTLYPHEIVFKLRSTGGSPDSVQLCNAQWEALPNFVPENSSVLPMIDFSGSMSASAGEGGSVRCIDVAVGLGLYLSTKNTGAFKNMWLNFSEKPSMYSLTGNTLLDKYCSLDFHNWGMNTNLEAAFSEILRVAVENKVQREDMPKTLMIFSDMQFDICVGGTTLKKNLKDQYKQHGYDIPKVVFWDLDDYGNSSAKMNSDGVALVSGFSPSLMTAVLNDDLEKFTPMNIMLDVLSSERYDY